MKLKKDREIVHCFREKVYEKADCANKVCQNCEK